MSILIYGMKKGKFCHQFSNFTIPPSMKIHKNEVKFKNWICQNFFPENKMDVNLQYKSKGGKSLTLKTLPQQMFRIVTFHVDHTVDILNSATIWIQSYALCYALLTTNKGGKIHMCMCDKLMKFVNKNHPFIFGLDVLYLHSHCWFKCGYSFSK